MNRILAIIWLLIAVLDFGWAWLSPETHLTKIRGTGLSLGWVAAFLAFYNLVRWWGSRLAAPDRRPPPTALDRRRQRAGAEPPDPNFNFTEAPPPGGITNSDGKR